MTKELDTYPRMVYKIYEIYKAHSLKVEDVNIVTESSHIVNQARMISSRVLLDLTEANGELFNHDFETLQDALQYIKDNKEELQYKELTVLPVINAR